MFRFTSVAACMVASAVITHPVLAATWEQVGQPDTQEYWVPDVVSTRSIVVTEPVYEWVAQEPWHPVTTLTSTAAVVVQIIPASRVNALFGAGQKVQASSGKLSSFAGQNSSGGASLSGLKSREVLGANRSQASRSRSSGSSGQATIQRGPNN